ncbi:MAG: DUF4342 domain-containing protein [Bacillus sp. (in: Bacteria)]|nr:DUF4342 domain-containing protein [Bacillus sp. (in: firmicutes)]
MEEIMKKIDLIRSRMNVGYREAREALEAAGGDVVQALINLEEKGNAFSEKVQERGHEFIGQLKGVLHKGRETRIKVKQGDRTVLEIPASLGALGLLGILASSELAVLGALGTVAAMSKNYTLEFEKADHRPGNGEAKPGPTPGEV